MVHTSCANSTIDASSVKSPTTPPTTGRSSATVARSPSETPIDRLVELYYFHISRTTFVYVGLLHWPLRASTGGAHSYTTRQIDVHTNSHLYANTIGLRPNKGPLCWLFFVLFCVRFRQQPHDKQSYMQTAISNARRMLRDTGVVRGCSSVRLCRRLLTCAIYESYSDNGPCISCEEIV